MNPPPLVSILLPVYNNMAYLGEAISSILTQTVDDWECIIFDDGSTEPVWQVIETFTDPRLVYMRHPTNQGLAAALNCSLDVARGRYFARMDSDDVSLPTRLEEQLALFTAGIGLVSCWGYTVTADGQRVPPAEDSYLFTRIRVSNASIRQNITQGNLILGPASVFPRQVFERIGYFDEKLVFAEDHNYWLRILQHYEVAVVPQELYQYRRHANNMSKWQRFSPQIDHAELAQQRARQFPTITHRPISRPAATRIIVVNP
jgi:glycosyltransferase involved in cell wall biosynthesis